MNELMKKLNEAKKSEKGFTLVELLVVILIIGILIAIAVPAFLGQTNSANNTSAQVDLRTAYTASASARVDNNGTFPAYATATTGLRARMVATEPSLDGKLVAAASSIAPSGLGTATIPAAGTIGVAADSSNVIFYGQSSNGTVYCVGTKTGGTVKTVANAAAMPGACNA